MRESSVLRFPISGKENEYFLVEVSSNGSQPLDLKLVGSESNAVFVVKLRHKRIAEYRASSGHCTDEEWEKLLISIFVTDQPVPDTEVKASVHLDSSYVNLSFRKNIQGITQRLGSIKLEEDENADAFPFDWCVSAIAAREKVKEDLVAASAKVQYLENSFQELKGQLDELIKTKEEDETQLLEKFRDLLNEKKVKIRQQQRLLASANVDPEKLANVGASQGTRKRAAEASRTSKRKVKEESESSDDGFEEMDVDQDGNGGSEQPDVGLDQDMTTEEEETASGTGSDDEPPPPAPTAKTQKGKGKAAPPRRSARASTAKEAPETDSSEEDDKALPPPRSLPFMKNKAVAMARATKLADEIEPDEESQTRNCEYIAV
ncbi:hypothetical protein F5B20DRAFT_365070 [Whalleya microplaca]|nr:hypothetical protein F5B20DRAFT_365070 [Whalleya microplaca]